MYFSPVNPRARSGRFASLMELYESNYVLLRVLAPDLRQLQCDQTTYVSVVSGCLDLELSAVKHEKYTTTLNLTYRFVSDARRPREPDLTIRIYHDARTCEVMSGLLQGMRYGPQRTRDLDYGYKLNRFLNKWLSYCLRQGHSFRDGQVEAYTHVAQLDEMGRNHGADNSGPTKALPDPVT